ncbi:gamma-glutamylcyclotransferase [Pseudohoeflea coraliihabitans]|uniref:glutathione-specific gamma-glutamylcyclotransferase n=1 Tax=Pseudohoeflea coraliihabitans TaxID=2860393 RepID=A0ABS6WN38_9HYPH|nr:gamma-glutamylcyclotransferase [Pseudohoeflea sp. DP4N28-3]MBW3096525.1 gamma-glutamylcyclotransferase [Pseudohoeflea sp. DP4N28-3]
MADLWVFGYGSLMWRPGFVYTDASRARLNGFHRSLCVLSHVHRGTVDHPGLVLGLDRGGSCVGLAFRVAGDERETVLAYLRERELVTHVYKETVRNIQLANGEAVQAVAFVVDRMHHQYAGRLPVPQAAQMIVGAQGMSGPNSDYVINTVEHLKGLGIRDRSLESLARLLEAAPGSP